VSWLGIATSQLISLTVMLIVAVGVADCVHVMSSYQYFLRKGLGHEQALTEAYGQTGLPILLTTITTMAGMSALAATGMTQFVIFGLTSAAGVLIAFIYTVVLLPVLLDLWHPRVKVKKGESEADATKRHWLQPMLDAIPAFVQKHRHLVNGIFISTFALCLYGAFQVKIDSNFAELYREGTTLRTAYEVVDGNMSGTGVVEIMVDMGTSDALNDPQVLKTMERLQEHVENRYSEFVVTSNSLADLVKETHAVMQDGSDQYRTIPDSEIAVAQLLYLFNSANPEARRALVNDDYSASHINFTLLNAGSSDYADFFAALQADITEAFAPLQARYPEMDVHATGTLAMMMRLMDDLSRSQFQSLTLAVLIISALMVLTLGSVQAGLLAIVPNLIPATLTFGLMGLLGIPLDGDTLMIAPLIIGIAVDDTIHFITHYRMALAKFNDMKIALISTIKEVGQAVTFTSLILGCGFFMLSFSDYLGLAKVGMFGSLAIFVALLCDLLFFPALIMWFKPRFGQKDVQDNLDFKGVE
ncbi:MAG: MMPL family transporter, partial [Gammaproteobacteria bacterium]|nr:MMPL family transporter [Gammaproteobacteria bacterium]